MLYVSASLPNCTCQFPTSHLLTSEPPSFFPSFRAARDAIAAAGISISVHMKAAMLYSVKLEGSKAQKSRSFKIAILGHLSDRSIARAFSNAAVTHYLT